MKPTGVVGAGTALSLVTAVAGLAAAQWRRLSRAKRLCALAPAAYMRETGSGPRVLLLGDSTGVGLGCDTRRESVAALLARDVREARITNLSACGARVADLMAQWERAHASQWDLVIVFAGGNDVFWHTPLRDLERDARCLLQQLSQAAPRVIWAGMANVGRAPLFLPPFSWWLSRRTRQVCTLLERCTSDAGASFVNFYREAGEDHFSADVARYYAQDRVHPSAAAYAWCYRHMRPALRKALGGALT